MCMAGGQLASPIVCVCVCRAVLREEYRAIGVKDFQRIPLYMPLRVSPAALLNIARESHMPLCPKRLAHFLAFLASH